MEVVSMPLAHLVFIHRNRTFVKFSKSIFGGVKLWQITENLPNLPKFSPTKVLHYTVCNYLSTIFGVFPGKFKGNICDSLKHVLMLCYHVYLSI